MYRISEFSEMTGLTKETLRYYEKAGLLEPAYVDPDNHYRYYDDGSYFLAVLLMKLRDLGFTIQEMLLVMNDASFSNLESLVIEKRDAVLAQKAVLNSRLLKIEQFLESGRGD